VTRILTDRMAQALQDGYPRGLFVSIEHPSGTGYFSTGVGSRRWNGQMWAGTGKFGSITPMKHTSEIAVQDIVFSISGIASDVAAGLADDVHNRVGAVWLYCLASDDSVVADPFQLINSVLDFQTFQVAQDGTTTISITAHSGFYTLARGVEEAWTPQNQKLTWPTDTGMDNIPGLQNQNLQWTPT
jgi:hypothetical protein